ncbi:MAG: PD-(D/E)XK nuclease family protein [Candidatus Aenigmatarchaeota archaeon]
MVKLGEGIGEVSASKLTTFYGCPFAFFLQYVEHEQVEKSAHLVFGEAIHYQLEQFYKKNWKSKENFLKNWWYYWFQLIPKKYEKKIKFSTPYKQKVLFSNIGIQITEEQAKNFSEKGFRIIKEGNVINMINERPPRKLCYNVNFQKEQFKEIGIELPTSKALELAEGGIRIETEQQIFFLIGMSILSKFWDRHRNRPAPFWYEKKFRAPIQVKQNGETKEYMLVGKFDRVDVINKKTIITDYKTGFTDMDNPVQQEIFHRSLQFTLYSKAYRTISGEKEEGLLLYDLRKMKIYPTKRSEEDYRYLEQCIKSADARIIAQDFTPFYGFHCAWCDYIEPCAIRKIGVGNGISSFIERMTSEEYI